MYIRLLVAARMGEEKLKVGTVVEFDDEVATQLITEGSAEGPVDAPEGEVVDGGTDNTDDGQKAQDGAGSQDSGEGNADPAADAEVVKIKKALDNQYKKDELAEAAYKVGVEFAADATKGAIIDAAVAQGKAEALLK